MLNANATSMQDDLGNGTLGFLGLTVSPQQYAVISEGIELVAPINPRDAPTLPQNPIATQINDAN